MQISLQRSLSDFFSSLSHCIFLSLLIPALFFDFLPVSPSSPPSLHPSASVSLPCSRLRSRLLTPRVTMTTFSAMMAIRIAKCLCHWRLLFSSGINFLFPSPSERLEGAQRFIHKEKRTQNIPGLKPGGGTQVNGDHSGFQTAMKSVCKLSWSIPNSSSNLHRACARPYLSSSPRWYLFR